MNPTPRKRPHPARRARLATGAASVIGVVGGFAPAWRAARIGVIDSIREA